MKKAISLFIMLTIVCSMLLCGCGKSNIVTIGMRYQAYDNNGSIIEVPKFISEGKNRTIDQLNNSINADLNYYINGYNSANDNDYEWYEVKSYPVTGDEYIQVIVTAIEYPNYATQGTAFSYNYDVTNDKILSLEEALSEFGTTTEAELAQIELLFPQFAYESDVFQRAELCGFFRFNEGVWIITRIYCSNSLADDHDQLFVYYTDSRTMLPFTDDVLLPTAVCDHLTPPLYYDMNDAAISDSDITESSTTLENALYIAADIADYLYPGYGAIQHTSTSTIDNSVCYVFDVMTDGSLNCSIAVTDDLSRCYIDTDYSGSFHRVYDNGAVIDTDIEYFIQ